MLRAGNGRGGYWTDVIGLADDHEDADGSAVLTFWQAQDKARLLVRGKDAAATGRPRGRGARRLRARSGGPQWRGGQRAQCPQSPAGLLLAKPVALLSVKELRHWRDGLIANRQPASVNRLIRAFKAALNLAAGQIHALPTPQHGGSDWRTCRTPTSRVASGSASRTCAALVAAAHAIDPAFGLWTEVAAVTGARPSQIARLDVADLQDGRADPRLLMPSSLKGKGRKRIERRPVPVPAGLAARLRQEAHGRALAAPLLAMTDGSRRAPATTASRLRKPRPAPDFSARPSMRCGTRRSFAVC